MKESIVLVEVEKNVKILEHDCVQLFSTVKQDLISMNLPLLMLAEAITIAATKEWVVVETITDEKNQLVFFIFRKMNGKDWAPIRFISQKVCDVVTNGLKEVAEALHNLAPHVKPKLWLFASENGLEAKDLLPEASIIGRIARVK